MASPDFYKEAKSIHEFTAVDSFGNDVSLDKYKGNVVFIFNIASNCGLTRNNYAKLMELKDKYYDSGLRILSFPYVVIVNIASQCGLTKSNYAKLTELKNKYYESGLRILSFPCNQFGSQMPEEDGEAMECHLKSANADVGDVFKKIDVNGDNASPLFKYLKYKQTGTLGSALKWNFTKFLVDKNGQPVDRFAPTTDPMDIASAIEKLL